ncbi:MAG: integral rane sensor signal transduction histidine kinase [Pedosphaera sp.]|nr:integral rane sensor signal transduction histidine kinase [Pedosphaera sp.]
MNRLLGKLFPQYVLAFAVFALVALLDFRLPELIGYEAIALVNLLAIVVLALFVSRGPILFGTILTGLAWNFLCAPPRYSFHISSFYDKMMFVTYLVVAMTIGQLTTRLRALREDEMKTKLLAESERLSRTLLNSVSHELRTPLSTITSAASEMNARGALTPIQKELLSEIETASARLNRVVQSLLNAARIQSGQLRPKLDWCDISELVSSVLHEVASVTGGRLPEVKITPGMPLVKMDFVLMQQALMNLLVNAAIHTPPATPVVISAWVHEGQLFIEVADHGAGLPADQLDRIFNLFHRAPAAKPGGTGLGLSIVKGFVEAQGGTVMAANRPGGGAVFTICMPAADMANLPEEIL